MSLANAARKFYTEESAAEVMAELEPILCLHGNGFFRVQVMLSLFASPKSFVLLSFLIFSLLPTFSIDPLGIPSHC